MAPKIITQVLPVTGNLIDLQDDLATAMAGMRQAFVVMAACLCDAANMDQRFPRKR